MIKLINWTARRAGGRITINGVNAADGQPLKVVGVDKITPSKEMGCIATRQDGTEFALVTN
jgi:hypothetical protein